MSSLIYDDGPTINVVYMDMLYGPGPRHEEGPLYGFSRPEVGIMPEDVRRYFSLLSRSQQEDQKIQACSKAKEAYGDEMDKIRTKITQTGTPIVAQMPNGDTWVMYRDSQDEPCVEKVQVVNL
jgi:hypothetical protein